MLEFKTDSGSITFDNKIRVKTGTTLIEATVKYLIVDRNINQTFIVTDSFLVVCKHQGYRGSLDIYSHYVFIGMKDPDDFLLAYYIMRKTPIYIKDKVLNTIDISGWTLYKDDIDA